MGIAQILGLIILLITGFAVFKKFAFIILGVIILFWIIRQIADLYWMKQDGEL